MRIDRESGKYYIDFRDEIEELTIGDCVNLPDKLLVEVLYRRARLRLLWRIKFVGRHYEIKYKDLEIIISGEKITGLPEKYQSMGIHLVNYTLRRDYEYHGDFYSIAGLVLDYILADYID